MWRYSLQHLEKGTFNDCDLPHPCDTWLGTPRCKFKRMKDRLWKLLAHFVDHCEDTLSGTGGMMLHRLASKIVCSTVTFYLYPDCNATRYTRVREYDMDSDDEAALEAINSQLGGWRKARRSNEGHSSGVGAGNDSSPDRKRRLRLMPKRVSKPVSFHMTDHRGPGPGNPSRKKQEIATTPSNLDQRQRERLGEIKRRRKVDEDCFER